MAKARATKAEELVDEFFRNEVSGPGLRGNPRSRGFDDLVKCLTESAPPESAAEDRDELMATIREQIIPRLVLAHFDDPVAAEACPDSRLPPDIDEVAAFSRIAASQDLASALTFVESLVKQGLSIGTILLHLIAPAARRLGDDWLEDLRSFAEVTLGLGTLQEVVHVIGPTFAPGIGDRGAVLLATAPAEQHTLGIHVLGEFVRRAGWTVQIEQGIATAELLKRAEAQHFDMIGISISNEQLVEPLRTLVRDVRRASRNPEVAIMVGGSLNLADQAESIGATFCTDPADTVRRLDAHA